MTTLNDTRFAISMCGEVIVKYLAILAVAPAMLLLQGYVFAWGWNRFAVLAFSVPQVSPLVAAGIMMLARFVAAAGKREERGLPTMKDIADGIMSPMVCWGILAVLWWAAT